MTRPTRTTLIGLAIVALLAGACSAGAGVSANPTGGSTSAPTIAPGASMPTTGVPGALPPASTDAWLAVGRKGAPGLEVILAGTREKMLDLPTGVPARADWGRIFTATVAGGKTTVRDVVVHPGRAGPRSSSTERGGCRRSGRTRCRWASPWMAPRSSSSRQTRRRARRPGRRPGSRRSAPFHSQGRLGSSRSRVASTTTPCRPTDRRSTSSSTSTPMKAASTRSGRSTLPRASWPRGSSSTSATSTSRWPATRWPRSAAWTASC